MHAEMQRAVVTSWQQRLAPLLGAFAAGTVCELAFVAGWPWTFLGGVLVGVLLIPCWQWWHWQTRRETIARMAALLVERTFGEVAERGATVTIVPADSPDGAAVIIDLPGEG